MFFLTPKNASKARLREAENARRNRAEIVAARSQGQVTRRDLIKMGILTTGGFLALKNGLSPFAKSAYADDATNVTGIAPSPFPRSSDTPFTFPMLRLHNLTPVPLKAEDNPLDPGHKMLVSDLSKIVPGSLAEGLAQVFRPFATINEHFPGLWRLGIPFNKGVLRQANTENIVHTVNLADPLDPAKNVVTTRNWPTTGLLGPREGRPPGEPFAHQRWDELISTSPHDVKGFVVSHGQIFDGFTYKLDADWPVQGPNTIWTFGEGDFQRGGNWVAKDGQSLASGVNELTFPALLQARYGEPVILRDYNNLPFDPADNGGFGRNEPTTHNHNAHNGAESDGAGNAHFFPGEYYDYLWSTLLARTDAGLKMSRAVHGFNGVLSNDLDTVLNIKRGDPRASSPTDDGDIVGVRGDFREIQGTMWFHDHRIAFTSENVYKGYAALLEYFSGPDRGYERPGLSAGADKVNLRFPSGWRNKKTWGNRDFDIYFLVQDVAFTPDGQQFFDIIHTDGFLGDVIHVNYQWKPVLNVLPRKYRFRILSAGMSRWVKLAIADSLDANTAKPVPVTQIANDGNLFPKLVRNLTELDQQGTAERYDIIVDFSRGQSPASQVGKEYFLVNLLEFKEPVAINTGLTLGQALSGNSPDPGVGAIMKFKVVDSVPSVDDPTAVNTIANACGANDMSLVNDPGDDWEIPTVEPVRTRQIELVPDDTEDSGLPFDHPFDNPPDATGRFTNEHWAVRTNGGAPHHTDMRRASNLPRPGDVEHWTLKSGTGWFHPLHLHFEEAKTLNRDGKTDPGSIHPTELNKRKDVWHVGGVCCGVRPSPTIQVTFGEFGGAYVNHCHNTVHEDNAMLIHYHLIRGNSNDSGIDDIHATVLPTPDPRVTGVTYVEACHLPEGNPQGFETGVKACPDVVGPVAGPQGPPPGGYVDLTGFAINEPGVH